MRGLVVGLVAAALVAAGCGGDDGGGGGGNADADPATVVPADSGLYLELDPSAEQSDAAIAFAKRVTGTDDPLDELIALAEEAAGDAGDEFDYEDDVEPWLGNRAGVGVTAFEPDGEGVIAAAVRDKDAARDFLEDIGELDQTYKGVDYVDDDGSAIGLVGDLLVLGTDLPAFKAAVDLEPTDSLAQSKPFKSALDGIPGEQLGFFFFDFIGISGKLDLGGAEQAILRQLQGEPVAGALVASDDKLTLESGPSAAGGVPLSLLGAAGPTPLIDELPGDAWGAFGAPGLADTIDQFLGLAPGGTSAEQLEQALGFDLRNDLLSWVGDVAIFIHGSTLADLNGGALVAVTDTAAARTGLENLYGNAARSGMDVTRVQVPGAEFAFQVVEPGAPRPIVAALSGKRAVLAYGVESATAALGAQETLGSTGRASEIRSVLGNLSPAFFVDIQAALALADSVPADPDFEEARTYLERLGLVALGESGNSRRLVLTAK